MGLATTGRRLREEAALSGSVSYFTGEPCRNGHIDLRYTNTGVCYACHRNNSKSDAAKNSEAVAARAKKARLRRLDAGKRESAEWVARNPGAVKAIKRRYREKHREQLRQSEAKRMRDKRKNDPAWRLARNMSLSVWKALKLHKNGRTWTLIVGYSRADLVAHLESLFRPGMTWKNYGPTWHVDHVTPLSWILAEDTQETKEEKVARAYALENLQPLFKPENLSKNNKYSGRFREKRACVQ